MVVAKEKLVINAPANKVFNAVADARNQTKWHPYIKTIEKISDGAIGKGTKFVGDYRRFGRNPFEITKYEPSKNLVFLAPSPQGPLSQSFMFVPSGSATEIEQVWELEPKPLGRLMLPLMRSMMRKNLKETGAALKQYLESTKE